MARQDLFKWERLSKPRIYSRSMRVTSNNDVQDWIKTVEEASTRAAEATFGNKYGRMKGVSHGKKLSAAVVEDTRNLDAAYNEAHDLLEGWVQEKLDLNQSADDYETIWSKPKSKLDVQREWDRLVDENVDPCLDYLTSNLNGSIADDKDCNVKKMHYGDDDDDDDSASVDAILQKLLNKNVLKDDIIKDLGLDGACTKVKDPTTKMKLRHEQVKENREKRVQLKQRRLQESREKKEAQYKARQIIMKEEHQKAACVKKEEAEIQKQMVIIRRQMDEECRKADEIRIREERDKREAEKWAMVQLSDEQVCDLVDTQRATDEMETRQRELLDRMREIEAREAKRNHQTLRRHFTAWYKVVIERQIELGKARALSDWKLMLRVWNAWKTYAHQRRLHAEARLHEENMKHDHRKWMLAQRHHSSKLLRQCFVTWQVNVTQQRSERIVANAQTNTKNKMAAFLEAASSGRLWSARSEISDGKMDTSLNERKVGELFAEAGKPRTMNASISRSSESTVCGSELTGRQSEVSCKTGVKTPREPWQVTKKNAKLPTGQSRRSSNESHSTPSTDQDNTLQKLSRPTASVPSTFEHRHNAQQKILQAQQNQLKEQQRLIEDLQYLQRQQLLQQQLVQQKLIGTHPSRADIASPLEAHLSSLQATVVNGGSEEAALPVDLKTANEPHPTGRSDLTEVTIPETISTDRTVSHVSNASKTKHESFLTAMEARASERARLKREREDRKRKLDLEKRERLAEEAAEKLRVDDEIKRQQREEHREKKRREKQEEAANQAALARIREQEILATEHRRVAILRHRGWMPWLRLMEMAREAERKADQHHTRSTVSKYLNLWHQTVYAEMQEKYRKADSLARVIRLRRCFDNWKRCGDYLLMEEGRARRFYERNLLQRVFTGWAQHVADERVQSWHRERKAKEHNLWRIQWNALVAWKSFPEFQRQEVEREKRREEMRKKVSAMLPDFQKAIPKTSVDLT